MGRFYCVEVNGLIDVEAPRMKLSTWASRLFSWCIRVTGLYRNADLFVCVASGIEEELLRRWPPLIGRTTTIGNGVDMDRFGAPDRELSRRSLGFADGTFVIGFVGLLCPWPGTEDFVSACHLIRKRGRQFRLIIVGGGERLESLKVQATELGLNDVTVFTGRVSPEEVPKYTACFDVACQPHNDPVVGKFGNSMKFWEYLAAGIPVIVSDMSESSRHVGLGLVGWKHRGGDPSDLANRIEYAMDHPDECKMIRAGNRAFAARGHTWSAVADSMTKAMAQRMT
jgi:glycosyltransferase involved in cell wall biosynthesis